jgi:hypothetical protein
MFGRDLYLDLIDRTNPIPSWYVINHIKQYTEDEFKALVYKQEDIARHVGNKFGVSSWISVNQYVTISFDEWLKLEDVIKKAICLEVESMSRERQKSHQDQEKKLEKLMAEQSSTLKFPSQTSSSINRFLS